MFCRNCGEENDNNAYKCVRCGAVLHRVEQSFAKPPIARDVPSYLVYAILATLFCGLPFGILALPWGIIAIVYAAQVNGKLASGDYAGAVNASRNAKKWCWISFGVGIACLIITVIIYIIMFIVIGTTESQY